MIKITADNIEKTAFIWDLDGTLLDSYEAILSSVMQTLTEMHIEMEEKEVLEYIIRTSVKTLFIELENKTGITCERFYESYQRIHHAQSMKIRAMDQAEDILEFLSEKGVRNFVFTHRGATSAPILKNTGLFPYFTELVTKEAGFPRKPAPDGNEYLVRKYNLDKANTWYVGDRSLDMESAANAGIRGILYLPEGSVGRPTGTEDLVIRNFMDITELFEQE